MVLARSRSCSDNCRSGGCGDTDCRVWSGASTDTLWRAAWSSKLTKLALAIEEPDACKLSTWSLGCSTANDTGITPASGADLRSENEARLVSTRSLRSFTAPKDSLGWPGIAPYNTTEGVISRRMPPSDLTLTRAFQLAVWWASGAIC